MLVFPHRLGKEEGYMPVFEEPQPLLSVLWMQITHSVSELIRFMFPLLVYEE